MSDESTGALYEERSCMPVWMFALLAFVDLVCGLSIALLVVDGSVLWPAIPLGLVAALMVFVAVVFFSLRTTITRTEVAVSFGGLFNRRVPLADVREVRAMRYNWKEFGGWGLRFNTSGGRAYSLPGKVDAVRIDLADGRYLVFSTEDPQKVVDAIARGRGESSS